MCRTVADSTSVHLFTLITTVVLLVLAAGCGLEQSERFPNDGSPSTGTDASDTGAPSDTSETGTPDTSDVAQHDAGDAQNDGGVHPPDTGDAGPRCQAQDALGEGACRAILGTKFDGSQCVTLTGCECQGDDCDELFSSQEACRQAYNACLGPSCSGQDIRGEGACAQFLGYAFTGDACAGISGCECKGADCDEMYASRSACREAHSRCLNQSPSCSQSGNTCGSDEFCNYPQNSCGESGQTGQCQSTPNGCPGYYSPICGCDDVTYGNPCMAHASGVDVAHDGECSE